MGFRSFLGLCFHYNHRGADKCPNLAGMKNACKGGGKQSGNSSKQGKLPRKYRRHQEGLVSKYDFRDTLIFGYRGEDCRKDYSLSGSYERVTYFEELNQDLKQALLYVGYPEDCFAFSDEHGQWINNDIHNPDAIGPRGYYYDDFEDPEPRKLRDMLGWNHQQVADFGVDMASLFPEGDCQKIEASERFDFEPDELADLMKLLRAELGNHPPIYSEQKKESIAASYRDRLQKCWRMDDAGILSQILEKRELTTYSLDDETVANLVFSPLWNTDPKKLSPGTTSKKDLYQALYGTFDAPAFLLNFNSFKFEPAIIYILLAKGYSIKKLFGLLREEETYTKRITKCLWSIPEETPADIGINAACLNSRGIRLEMALQLSHASGFRDLEPGILKWFEKHHAQLQVDDVDFLLDYMRHQCDESMGQAISFRAGIARMFREAREYASELKRLRRRQREAERMRRLAEDRRLEEKRRILLETPFADGQLGYKIKRSTPSVEFIQLNTEEELIEEGSQMHHCVGMYYNRCRSGSCAIVSMRVDGEATLTIEVISEDRTIGQVRGKYNRFPSKKEKPWVKQWAKAKSLVY